MGLTLPDLRERDLDALRRVFARFPYVQAVKVFGSRATGTAQPTSDLDLAISAPGANPGQIARLRDALEEAPIIYRLDVVWLEDLTNERLREKIEREGKTLDLISSDEPGTSV